MLNLESHIWFLRNAMLNLFSKTHKSGKQLAIINQEGFSHYSKMSKLLPFPPCSVSSLFHSSLFHHTASRQACQKGKCVQSGMLPWENRDVPLRMNSSQTLITLRMISSFFDFNEVASHQSLRKDKYLKTFILENLRTG